jgi:beta-lactam-binding protein with PASTA domain
MIDLLALDPQSVAAGFISGAVSVGGALYAKWKLIPKKKKVAAFEKLKTALADGELTLKEFVSAVSELI